MVGDTMTEFGGLVSTSNEIVGDSADVTTDKCILWTIEFRL
jgi:thiamine pyrophosphokinase